MEEEKQALGPTQERAMCIDLDGTLVKTDLLVESILSLLSRNPVYLFALPFWLLKGKAGFKREIALRASMHPETLPYEQRVLDLLQANPGRTKVLCTASDQLLADRVAGHLGVFDRVIASNGAINMAGTAKARILVDMFGEGGYDYAGNARVDKPVWKSARGAWVFNAGKSVLAMARTQGEVLAYFPPSGNRIHAWLQAVRPHQWLKNLLIFVPLLAAHQLFEPDAVMAAALAFLAFCLCASSTYIVNDLMDIQADRLHPRKRKRPFASGSLPAIAGLAGGLLLACLGLAVSLLVSPYFAVTLAGYYLLTLAYSLKLKRVAIIDVVLLAGLYTTRIVAGAVAIQSGLSFWLLAFSMFIFLSLALVKRYAEIHALPDGNDGKTAGRDYRVGDLPIIASLGSSSGYLAVLVLAMYINSPESLALYRSPIVLWALCPIFLYWISRVWFLTTRGEMHDDPVVFAMRDGVSQAIAIATVAIMVAASFAPSVGFH